MSTAARRSARRPPEERVAAGPVTGATGTAGAPRGPRQLGRRPLWLVAPAAVLLAVVVAFPALLNAYLSFFNVNLTTLRNWYSAPFSGVQNYVNAITNSNAIEGSALHALWLSVSFSVLTTAVATPLGFAAALAISDKFRGSTFFRSWFLVPYVIPIVVTATVFRTMFLNGTGLIDHMLKLLSITDGNTYWLIGPHTFWAMTITEIWAVWPFSYLMVTAGLTSISPDLYEAAELDGAGYIARLRYIVLPEIKGILFLSILLSTIFHLGNFTLPYVMFGDPPPSDVDVLPIDIYYRAFTSSQYSAAAATAVLMLVVLAIPGYIYLRRTRLATGQEPGERMLAR
jgi:multiple sugar transport system permease protein